MGRDSFPTGHRLLITGHWSLVTGHFLEALMDPQSLLFLPTHEWVFIQGDVATVGISQFAVEQLTDLLLVELPRVGDPVVAGKSFGEIESVKAVSDLYSPVDGQVVEVNSSVATDVQV